MRRSIRITAALFVAFSAGSFYSQDRRVSPLGQGSNRVALVIGNAAYANLQPLINPVNDAHDVALALRNTGFR
jgi:hypothetical protein